MKEKIEILRADIKDDLKSIQKIKSDYNDYWKQINRDKRDHHEKMVIGYLLHNFYNACESIFANIARVFENNVGQAQWHKKILKRMKMEIEDIRPAVMKISIRF